MAVQHVSKSEFKKEVLDHQGVVFVDFYADWCGPCRMTGPVIDQLAEEMSEIKFVKVNVDQNQELAGQYSVFSIPTFIIFKDGKPVSQFTGARDKQGFLEEINKIQ